MVIENLINRYNFFKSVSMNFVKFSMIVLVFLGTSCKKHEELSFCDFDFMIGKWDVSVVKK